MLQTTALCFGVLLFVIYLLYADLSLRLQLAEAKETIVELSVAEELPIEEEVIEDIAKTDEDIINLAFDFIKDLEGMHLEAYWDIKRYSIGCGTISYEGEVITLEEARVRCHDYIGGKLLQINRVADNLSWNKKVALLSFMHNTGYNYKVLMYAARGDDASVIYLMSMYVNAGGEYMAGLDKRRKLEILYYNK